jgi:hypothetical protein
VRWHLLLSYVFLFTGIDVAEQITESSNIFLFLIVGNLG